MILQGILLFPGVNATHPGKLIRLWVHEVYRVFYDRLVDSADRQRFFEIVKVSIAMQVDAFNLFFLFQGH